MDVKQGQMTASEPVPAVAEVKPLHEAKRAVPPASDFHMLVVDTLHALEVAPDISATAAPLIDAAHASRLQALQGNLLQEKRAVAAYASMDRVTQGVLQFVKRTIGQALEINARQAAYNDMLGNLRHQVRELVKDATDKELDQIPLAKLVAALEPDAPPLAAAPVIVGMAVDQRFTSGWFSHPNGQTRMFTFLGWSLVIHHPQIRTVVEPTFLTEDGHTTTAAALQLAHGWQLTNLQ